MKASELTDGELIKQTRELYDFVNVIDCFGTKDLMILDTFLDELNRRGYLFEEHKNLKIEKEKK